jgi:hypothetical protein
MEAAILPFRPNLLACWIRELLANWSETGLHMLTNRLSGQGTVNETLQAVRDYLWVMSVTRPEREIRFPLAGLFEEGISDKCTR